MKVKNGIVRIRFFCAKIFLKWAPLEISHMALWAINMFKFKIRNIIICLIYGCECYNKACQNSNSTFNVLFKLVLHITYQSSVLIISYH